MGNRLLVLACLGGLALAASFAPVSWAQVTPGTVGDTLKRSTPMESSAAPEPAFAESPQPAVPVPAAADDQQIVVHAFVFSGNTLYSTDTLAPLVAGWLDHPISLLDLYAAADAVTAFYRHNGYTVASAQVPAQEIGGGTVRLQVMEGYVSGVAIQGVTRYGSELLRASLDLPRGTIYRGERLERGLYRLNDLPGLSARAVLQPGADFGTSDIVVNVEEKSLAAVLSVDNYGRKNIGEFRAGGSATLNNPLMVADQLQLVAVHAQSGLLNYGSGEYSLPLTPEGQRIAVSYGKALFKVTSAGIAGDNARVRVAVRWPLLHTRADTFGFTTGVTQTRASADLSGLSISRTRITLFDLSALYSHRYAGAAASQVQGTVATDLRRQTRDDLGADGTRHQRLRIELDAQHLQPVPWTRGLAAYLHADGVWSPDPLADTEQFSLGGPDSVRAYPAAEVRGDRGYLASAGLQQLLRWSKVDVQARAFIDGGQTFVAAPPPGVEHKNSLTGYGLGFDLRWRALSLKLDGAKPFHSRPSSDGRDRGRIFGVVAVAY